MVEVSTFKLLKDLYSFSQQLKFPEPLLVGGTARDLYLNGKVNANPDFSFEGDYDLTCNDGGKTCMLGLMFAVKNNFSFKYHRNSHIAVFLSHDKFDFSSGFMSDRVKEAFEITDKRILEVYSRDFTVNTLHLNFETKKFIDYTGKAYEDIKLKKIRAISTPEIIFKDNPKRVMRSIYLASKLGFEIEQDIVDYIKNNIISIGKYFTKERKQMTDLLSKSLGYDEEKTMSFMEETNLFRYPPLVGRYKDVLIRRKLLSRYLLENGK